MQHGWGQRPAPAPPAERGACVTRVGTKEEPIAAAVARRLRLLRLLWGLKLEA